MAEKSPNESFFAEPKMVEAVKRALGKVRNLPTSSDFEQGRNAIIIVALNLMRQPSEPFEQHCVVSIRNVGRKFSQHLQGFNDTREYTSEFLDPFCALCLCFLSEYVIASPGDYSIFGNRILDGSDRFRTYWQIEDFARKNVEKFTGDSQLQVHFALHGMPGAILKYWLHSDEAQKARQYHDSVLSLEGKIAAWDKTIEEKEKRAENIRKIFSDDGDRLNIDGLASGFQKLLDEKNQQKKRLTAILHSLERFLLCMPIVGLLLFSVLPSSINREDATSEWIKWAAQDGRFLALGLSLSLLTALLLYFYRVKLAEYKSVCAQILQIQLRKTLCQFIQNYTTSDIADDADKKSAMGKFENVVFSGMVADDSQIPTTFEGLEQLVKVVVKAIKREK